MKFNPLLIPIVCLLLAGARADATDVIYTNNLALYVIHDAEQGSQNAVRLDHPVGIYIADAGVVVYVKGNGLYLIRDTRNPQPLLIDNPVGLVKMDAGVLAYNKGKSLYVRRVEDDPSIASKQVVDSIGCSTFDVKDGKVTYLRGGQVACLVTDIGTGASIRLASPATGPVISK